ncbi:hypothetical protein F5X68DRAFT_227722 [Plectosphaerella plurivora]|uniref:Uncharacterized protein n=1 Tax=Plectosphaerella plurivora TaxID=936078 RepID=A0A9P8VLE1_9PEZI|nr:hypothetical protein F5X68DRAFT_227722 [Plectosphaerella plurivora]
MYGDCLKEDPDDPNDPDKVLKLLSERNEPDASEMNSAFGGSRIYGVGTPARDCSFKIKTRGYPSSGKLFGMTGRSVIEKVLRLQSQCCSDTNIELLDKTLFSKQDVSDKYSTEHIEELQFAISLMQSAASGILPSEAPMQTPKIPCQLLIDTFSIHATEVVGAWKIKGSKKPLKKPAELLFEAFGTSTQSGPLVLLENGINYRKSTCFSYNREVPGDEDSPFATSKPFAVDSQKFTKAVLESIRTGLKEDLFLQVLRETIGAWKYIHQKEVAIQTAHTRGLLSTVALYLSQEVKGLENFRKIYREVETDWWNHAARHCKAQGHYLIDIVDTEYRKAIAQGVTPANWPNVENALIRLRRDVPIIQTPVPPADY